MCQIRLPEAFSHQAKNRTYGSESTEMKTVNGRGTKSSSGTINE